MNTAEGRRLAYEWGRAQARTKSASFWIPVSKKEQATSDALDIANLTSAALPFASLGLAQAGHALEQRYTPDALRTDLEQKLRTALDVSPELKVRYGTKPFGAYFSPSTNKVHVAKNPAPSIFAHELGHATGKPIGNKLYGYSKALGGAAVPISMLVQGYYGPDSTAANVAQYVPGILAAPTLYEEARASLRGLRALHRIGGTGAMARGILPLLGAFGTYGATAVSPIIAGKILKAVLKPHEKKNENA